MNSPSPRSSTSSDSFASGRASPINGFDSSAALIIVPDSEDSESPNGGVSFDFSSEDDDTEDESDLQLERIRDSPIPPLSSISVFLYLLAPFTKLGALLAPSADLPLNVALPAFVLFAVLSAFTRQLWYMLARYVRRADLEEIVLETFARGRGKETRRAFLRQLVRFFTGLLRVLVAALYLRFSVDLLLPYSPDVLAIPARPITTLILAAFIAPLVAARTLGSRAVIYASWASIAAYAVWFSCTAYMHAKHILVPVAESSSLGTLWHGIPAFSFTFATMSTVPLYASLKGTVSPLHPKPRRSQSFKLLSALSIAIGVAGTLPLVFFEASPKPPVCLKTTVAVLSAASLLLSVPSLVITTPQLPLPLSIRRATNFPLSKVLVYILIIILSVLPASITRVGSDLVLLLAFASTYMVPALLHIITHNFRRPLSIVIPPTTPTMSSELSPSDSANDELLQRKEHMLQRRRLGRRLVWDIGVWVLLVPVGGGGLVWAVGRMTDKW
ncbi:hypothetical protein K466DRAFT_481848 [Polyporus arcularius HHB13444]|uniref:Amino acid transporter transmembrane domain-containing protein n=1 Tax=Polyporus arcularius HHB13444 TaxID=1314778 RepID=A0A5C3PQX9_9APHY|nr:hypothetical protein K466DRAFT_481848 [Polyporus arcularius HHB13444]